ncbi:MAG: molybdenum cofactor guanylyltransferase [Nitrospirae bacterium]|nr:MAG: molybdenum cofactor guanylyltransferase [Nitrospirota bacterium]
MSANRDTPFTPDVTGILLAGGQSRRMGQDKRWVTLEGIPLFHRTLTALIAVFTRIIVVVARRDAMPDSELPAGVEIVQDLIPNCGSAGGLYTGLACSPTPRAFVVACDMPFLNPDLVRHLCAFDPNADVLMVNMAGKVHPMHALYSKQCVPVLAAMLEEKQFKIQNLCTREDLAVRILLGDEIKPWDPQGLSFLNINTPMDLEFAEKLLRNRSGLPSRKSDSE